MYTDAKWSPSINPVEYAQNFSTHINQLTQSARVSMMFFFQINWESFVHVHRIAIRMSPFTTFFLSLYSFCLFDLMKFSPFKTLYYCLYALITYLGINMLINVMNGREWMRQKVTTICPTKGIYILLDEFYNILLFIFFLIHQ